MALGLNQTSKSPNDSVSCTYCKPLKDLAVFFLAPVLVLDALLVLDAVLDSEAGLELELDAVLDLEAELELDAVLDLEAGLELDAVLDLEAELALCTVLVLEAEPELGAAATDKQGETEPIKHNESSQAKRDSELPKPYFCTFLLFRKTLKSKNPYSSKKTN